ncbi:MAG: amidase family protein [Steroidobacteraceae bacterium]
MKTLVGLARNLEAGAITSRRLVEECLSRIDPRVSSRIRRAGEQSAADYLDLIRIRADLQRRIDGQLAEFDAVVLPTTPIIAPLLQELKSDEAYLRINGLALRNTAVANFLDRCAVSIPCHQPGSAPVGLMLMGAHGSDRRLLALAAAVEALGIAAAATRRHTS